MGEILAMSQVDQTVVQDSLIRENDIIELYPLWGQKKKILLRRKLFIFCKKELTRDSKVYAWEYHLASRGSIPFKLEVRLIQSEQEAFYECVSCNGQPFLYNSRQVYHCRPQQGDEIHLGQNLLRFSKNNQNLKTNLKANRIVGPSEEIIKSNLPILIEGETGTGKTTLAQHIHQQSGLEGDFIHLNLSAYSPGLLESELFGHSKGAFTGALKDYSGAVALSEGGTLFLDEIDSLPLTIQIKLLLFLDSKKYRPVGSLKERVVNCRLIFAAGRPMASLVSEGLIRKDFYFRLASGRCLSLPTLRENKEEIQARAREYCYEKGHTIAPDLLQFYAKYSWPGNLRQLYSHLEQKVILAKNNLITYCSVDEALSEGGDQLGKLGIDENYYEFKKMKDLKRDYCLRVYHKCEQNIELTAKVLGISGKSVRRMIHEY